MNPLKTWQRRSIEEKKLFLLIISLAFLGSLAGYGLGQFFGKGELLKSDIKSDQERILFTQSLKPAWGSGKFLLKTKNLGQPYLFNGNVIYLKNKKTVTAKTVIQSPALVEVTGSKTLISELFQSFAPIEKINGGYFSKKRESFIWLKKRKKRHYLIYSENIKNYPGDVQ